MLKGIRSGFTLAEVLVSLAIIAVLSAILIPTLAGKARQADGSRLSAGLVTLQTAVKAFATDVHRYPGKVIQLTDEISSNSKDVYGQDIPSHLETSWKGPYLFRDYVDFMGTVDIDPSFKPVMGDNGIKYLTIQLNLVQSEEFEAVELVLDAGTPLATSSTEGVIRYSGTTLKFLAIPLI